MSSADIVLTIVLVIVLPAYMLLKSLAARGLVISGNRIDRYRRTIGIVTTLSVVLATLWFTQHRPVALLGLGMPDRTAIVLIAIAVGLIGFLAIAAPRARRPTNTKRDAAAQAMMPVGQSETAWYIGFAVAVGVGWEVLYRGYLWWALSPLLGSIGAVAVMGVSYGIAHGYRGVCALAGSIVSALLFATAYALTQSLWWLIVVHVGLPLIGLRLIRKPAL